MVAQNSCGAEEGLSGSFFLYSYFDNNERFVEEI